MVDPDATGEVSWAVRMGGSGQDAGLCVAVDSTGAVVVGGYFASFNFFTTTTTSSVATRLFNTNQGEEDAFVAR